MGKGDFEVTQEAFVYHACTRKIRYTTARAAKNVMRAAAKRGKIVLVKPYKCRFCGGWHLGHPKEKK